MTRRIRTILYGDQQIEATELDLLHTPAMQRLYDLHQLGLTDRVFVDASHSRLQHVIGVLQQVDNIIEAIAGNLERRKHRRLEYRAPSGEIKKETALGLANYVRRRRRAARLMGLLHDLTHAPFGHTLEDEIELQPQKHDDPERQADAFYRLLCQYIGWLAIDNNASEDGFAAAPSRAVMMSEQASSPAERFASLLDAPAMTLPPTDDAFIDYVAEIAAPLLDRRQRSRVMSRAPGCQELAALFRDLRFAMRALLWLDALHKDRLNDLLPPAKPPRAKTIQDDGVYPFERLIDRILARAGEGAVAEEQRFVLQRDAFLLDVIGNTICADLLDYARRDSHFAGLKLDYDVDRIVENFTIVSHRRNRSPGEEAKADYGTLEPLLRTAISIFSHKLRIDVPGELMNLLQVRFYVYQRVLFHPTKCIAGAMLGSAVQLAGWKELPTQYRFVGDAVFLHEMSEVARFTRDLLSPFSTPGAERGERLTVSGVSATLLERLDELPPTVTTVAAKELLTARQFDTVAEVLHNLRAAIRLLDRLSARRYHRPVFRLLPNVAIPGLDLNAANVAAYFLKANNRARAEREIEERAGLPRGTVTIHCPSGDGPKKIAEILILSERKNGERALLLREIGGVDDKIFARHESAIRAVEAMYASMWRLVVSVAPPFHAQHAVLTKRISRVLLAALRREGYDSVYGGRPEEELDAAMDSSKLTTIDVPGVPNDDTMVLELEAADASEGEDVPPVRLFYGDGRQEMRSEAFLTVADKAVPRLEETNLTIKGYVRSGRWAAGESREVTLTEEIDRSIPRPQTDTRPADIALGEDRPQRAKRKRPADPTPDLLSGNPGYVVSDDASRGDPPSEDAGTDGRRDDPADRPAGS